MAGVGGAVNGGSPTAFLPGIYVGVGPAASSAAGSARVWRERLGAAVEATGESGLYRRSAGARTTFNSHSEDSAGFSAGLCSATAAFGAVALLAGRTGRLHKTAAVAAAGHGGSSSSSKKHAPRRRVRCLAAAASTADNGEESSGTVKKRKRPRKNVYPAHLRESQVEEGLKAGRFVKGKVMMFRKSCTAAALVTGGTSEEIILLGPMALNRAMDGDIVVVERLDKAQQEAVDSATRKGWHQTEMREEKDVLSDQKVLEIGGTTKARVVCVLERSKRDLVGSFLKKGEGEEGQYCKVRGLQANDLKEGDCVFEPSDVRFPYIIVRTPPGTVEQYAGKRITVNADVWDKFSKFPRGHLSGTLGMIGDIEVETQMILKEHSVCNDPFTDEVLACLPPSDFQPGPKELQGREDFRGKCVFSIDPPGCEDVDDALSCEPMENGNFRIGVHIADVTHYVHPGTAIDQEAAERCTSVYLVDRRIDMLPKLLTTDVCSLRCDGKDRLVFSAIFELTPQAEIVSERFCRSVIKSAAALSYAEAQERLDGPEDDTSEITTAIRNLNSLAVLLRAARREMGCLELESEEIRFEFDEESKQPTSLFRYQSRQTNKLIEEFMLLANQATARKISKTFKALSVLRHHPQPKKESLEELTKLLGCHGIKNFKFSSNRVLADSLNEAVKPDDPFFNRLVRIMTTRSMEEAQYICTGLTKTEEWYHYGLAMTHYTHFTSPIRRYADCVVHRFLAAALEMEQLPVNMRQQKDISEQVAKLNFKHRMAQWADRASTDLHVYMFFKAKGEVITEGVVMRVKPGETDKDAPEEERHMQQVGASFLQVAVEEYGAEGFMELDPNYWRVIPDTQRAMGRPRSPCQGMKINIFDRITVKVEADPEDTRCRALKISFVSLDAPSSRQQAPAASEEAAPAAAADSEGGALPEAVANLVG
eukprot:TRINITY_DN20210_c0_g1_i1.p1 TRINITY_DN20210_c0_g1~~TRINITY_DN20210_c0_g1_i1.p1  ORF type:complete len:934 (+),score=265.66 TRINITY_DN20210_c0_g1_i1:66-2867(+)